MEMEGSKFAMKSFTEKFEVILKGIYRTPPFFFLALGKGCGVLSYFITVVPYVLCSKVKRALGFLIFFGGSLILYLFTLVVDHGSLVYHVGKPNTIKL